LQVENLRELTIKLQELIKICFAKSSSIRMGQLSGERHDDAISVVRSLSAAKLLLSNALAKCPVTPDQCLIHHDMRKSSAFLDDPTGVSNDVVGPAIKHVGIRRRDTSLVTHRVLPHLPLPRLPFSISVSSALCLVSSGHRLSMMPSGTGLLAPLQPDSYRMYTF
jgi:hypothetical protein